MADLVISDADLQFLKRSLRLALSDLEPLIRAIRNVDHSCVGVPAAMDALKAFSEARCRGVEVLGEGLAGLAQSTDSVREGMTAADLLLSEEAQGGL